VPATIFPRRHAAIWCRGGRRRPGTSRGTSRLRATSRLTVEGARPSWRSSVARRSDVKPIDHVRGARTCTATTCGQISRPHEVRRDAQPLHGLGGRHGPNCCGTRSNFLAGTQATATVLGEVPQCCRTLAARTTVLNGSRVWANSRRSAQMWGRYQSTAGDVRDRGQGRVRGAGRQTRLANDTKQ